MVNPSTKRSRGRSRGRTLDGMLGSDDLDSLYQTLAEFGPDRRDGYSNHAPMVVEALVERGEVAAARAWLARNLEALAARPLGHAAIGADWRAALGHSDRFGDWVEHMRDEIAGLGWRAALERWAGRLAPGVSAAATHGLLRTAHAVRAVAARPSPARLAELADGLALWAANYQTLPGRPVGAGIGGRAQTVEELGAALERVPRVPRDRRRLDGLITTALAGVAELPEFEAVITHFDPGPDPSAAGQRLARAFAQMFLDQVHDARTAIVFTHTITSTAAVLWMAAVLPSERVGELLRYVWQTGAALLSTYAELGGPSLAGVEPSLPEDPERLLSAAIAHADDHVIKLSAACLGLFERSGDPRFVTVPQRARAMISPA